MKNFFLKNKIAIDSQIQRSVKNNDNLIDQKLRESELRYRRLFESAKDGILILDFETGRIVDANPYIIKIIDYTLHDIIGKELWEIGLFSNKEQSELAFIELKANDYVRFEDMPVQSPNGKITEVEFISNVYLANNIKVIQCNIRNITERKKLEKKQELSTNILSILSNQDNWKRSINDILDEIKNFIGIEAIGIRLKKNDEYPFYASKGYPEYFIQLENSLCKQNDKGKVIRDNKGKPIPECITDNIISGKIDHNLPYFTTGGSFYCNAISELLNSTGENEIPYSILVQCSAEGYQSIAYIPLYSGKEIIGLLQLNDKKPDMLPLENFDFFEKIGCTIGIAFARIQNEYKIIESELSLKKQNAEFYALNIEYASLNEELIESLNRIQDINKKLIEAKAKSEESNMLKSAFLANMSHEIRTPMNAIMGFSGFLLQKDLSIEKIQDYAQIIYNSTNQLLGIISDIIDISKIETGQINIDLEMVNINQLINDLFTTYQKILKPKNISFNCSCEFPNALIQVKADGNRVKQVFCNLLNNAIKFTKEGEIEFGYNIKGNFVEFFVKDTGIGIAKEYHELIFERFRQVKKPNGEIYDGNGLGLSISKALIEKLDGTITVYSELYKGSIFKFTIPYLDGTEKEIASEVTTKSENFDWSDKTILIVDDDQYSHALFEEILSDSNANLVHVWNGKEAVELVKNNSDISLILMDIKMPYMDGYKATRIIKKIYPKLPVIAQTAFALTEERKLIFKAGCDNYLSKPIDKILLKKTINTYLFDIKVVI